MTQSVELLLDPYAEAAVLSEWQALHEAGLPSEVRSRPSASHRPHLTLFAADQLPAAAEEALSVLVSGLVLDLQLGALTLFGPRRDQLVLVHAVVASMALLQLQQAVAAACEAETDSYFAPGRWTPHVTLARRMSVAELPAALRLLVRRRQWAPPCG